MENTSLKAIGPYKINRQLSRDSTTVSYEALDTRNNKDVVIRFFFPGVKLSENYLKRFAHGAGVLKKLDHPHLSKVIDHGLQNGIPYLVRQMVSSRTLREFMSEPFPWVQAARLLAPVAKALVYAHENHMIHRDVRPENIFVNREGTSLADIGTARLLELESETSRGSASHDVARSIYMAPEQLSGKAVPQTDIYALGVIFYEMVTGQKPFHDEQWSRKNPQTIIPDACALLPELPEPVAQVIQKALALHPRDRFSSMEAFSSVLEILGWSGDFAKIKNLMARRPSEKRSKRVPAKDDGGKRRKRKKRFGAVAVFIALFAAAIILTAGYFSGFFDAPAGNSEMTPQGEGAIANQPEKDATPELTHVLSQEPVPETVETLSPTETITPAPTLGIGSTMISPIDGMQVIYVPAGEFVMGSDDRNANEQPSHMIYLDDYWIDRTEVTNGKYAQCVADGVCRAPVSNSSNTQDQYYGSPEFDQYPVIFVTWDDANTYCHWAGRRLPTEAEWEKAARGSDARICPWGNDAPSTNLVNFNWAIGDTTPVGSYPAGVSPYGAVDMSGNVWEWVADWYDSNYYNNSPIENPQGPSSGGRRVLRGGSWYYEVNYIRAAFRFSADANSMLNDLGFRCALSDTGPSQDG
jgi:serine/threonine-protein kinase